MAGVACAAALTSLMLLAVIRGNLFAEHAMLTHSVRSAMTKLLVVALAIIPSHGRVLAQEWTNLVIAIDLSQSVAFPPDFQQELHYDFHVDNPSESVSRIFHSGQW